MRNVDFCGSSSKQAHATYMHLDFGNDDYDDNEENEENSFVVRFMSKNFFMVAAIASTLPRLITEKASRL